MFKLAILSVLLSVCAARRYGGGGGGGGGYGGDSYGSIELPVKSSYNREIIESHSERDEHPTYVDVEGRPDPVYMTFKTESSPLYVRQEHKNRGGSYQYSKSRDEPHHLVHEVEKEVRQELREVIKPYRKIVQVIEPVREERVTKVHKNSGRGGYGGSSGGGGGGYGKNNGYSGGY